MNKLDFKQVAAFDSDAKSVITEAKGSKSTNCRPRSTDPNAKRKKLKQMYVIRKMLKNEKTATAILREQVEDLSKQLSSGR